MLRAWEKKNYTDIQPHLKPTKGYYVEPRQVTGGKSVVTIRDAFSDKVIHRIYLPEKER